MKVNKSGVFSSTLMISVSVHTANGTHVLLLQAMPTKHAIPFSLPLKQSECQYSNSNHQ